MSDEVKTLCVSQEQHLGRQITLAHIIARPDQEIYKKLGLNENEQSLGIIHITPSEAAIIASDIALKSGVISVDFVDRTHGTIIVSGDLSSIDFAFQHVVKMMGDLMQFSVCPISRS